MTGTLQGEAANRFAADALRLGSAQQAETRTADGICALAAKDWPRGTLIIDGQTSDHDLARSVALVDRLTGGDAQMKMKVSQYVNQGSLMALQTAMSRGDLGNRTAAGAALVPLGGFNYTYTLAADEGGGIRLTFDASMSRLQGMTNAEDGSLLETDPERSSGTFSFGLRIAPDLGVSVAQPLSYSLQTQPLD